jgi:hypothetical protein
VDWKILTSPIIWACLNVIGSGFVANAPEALPYLWVAKWVEAIFAGVLMIMLHPPKREGD